MSLIRRSNDFFPSFFDGFGKDFFDDLMPFNSNQSLPAVNIMDKENEYRIEVAAPGLKKEDFKVNMEGNILTVQSEKETRKEENNEKYARREFGYSSFTRSFTLPEGTDAENVNASYNDGILSIQVPKKEEARKKVPKQIAIA
ncbi:MAG TPA: Hsp20/alpha crystallin family protein [Cytophagales bacterium]|nr:Hsp20/alpha crystallin family protein [Cytophagales bacterium]